MIQEREKPTLSGLGFLPVLFLAQLAAAGLFLFGPHLLGAGLSVLIFLGWFGFFMVQPNEGKVLQLFGQYVGTTRSAGLRWANPFYSKKSVSLRVRNFESSKLKVNDKEGSPIEIAAVVVWMVVDTAEAVFEVDNYEEYVHIQSESALRNLASRYLGPASSGRPRAAAPTPAW